MKERAQKAKTRSCRVPIGSSRERHAENTQKAPKERHMKYRGCLPSRNFLHIELDITDLLRVQKISTKRDKTKKGLGYKKLPG